MTFMNIIMLVSISISNSKLLGALLIFAAFCCRAQAVKIVHIEADGSDLVETRPTNYAISGSELSSTNWLTVSLNGDNVMVVEPECSFINKNVQSLSQAEKSALSLAQQRLGTALPNDIYSNYSRGVYTSTGSNTYSTSGWIGKSNFQSKGMSITKGSDEDFSISKKDMPDNLLRLFVSPKMVAFVYKDGKVLMKPRNCLKSEETQLIETLKKDVLEEEERFRQNMQAFNQNMQAFSNTMQQNMKDRMDELQTNMQNLQERLSNMFS